MSVRHFIFVEFSDPVVRNFLDRLRFAFALEAPKDSPHITVRGPYANRPDAEYIERWRQEIRGHGIFLIDAGVFKTPKGYAVFFHAKSRVFDEIWYKPDYPSPKNKRTPHLTLYETKEKWKADLVLQFLATEEISVFTLGVDLTVYTSKQYSLIGSEDSHFLRQYTPARQERIFHKPGMLDRATNLGHLLKGEGAAGFQPLLI
jgi:hypothetical protein